MFPSFIGLASVEGSESRPLRLTAFSRCGAAEYEDESAHTHHDPESSNANHDTVNCQRITGRALQIRDCFVQIRLRA